MYLENKGKMVIFENLHAIWECSKILRVSFCAWFGNSRYKIHPKHEHQLLSIHNGVRLYRVPVPTSKTNRDMYVTSLRSKHKSNALVHGTEFPNRNPPF